MHYETIIVETHGRVGLVRFNRPKAMNAINSQLIEEFARAIADFEHDAEIGCLLVAG
ncbi:MAG: putative phenylacetic acid degradation enoyl-CoA hydratase, partial [Hyphomicrobiales bacterium]|nr:putative phenylacetic acid degradation enoyl-CoA hydratase [Hyphomicrobiales bacterium]